MRSSSAFLVVLLAALLVPFAVPRAAAQTPAATDGTKVTTHLLDDAGGDLKLAVAGTQQDPAGRWAAADLKALDVIEDPDTLTLVLQVATLQAPQVPFTETIGYAISFRHADQVYRLVIESRGQFGAAQADGHLEAYDQARQRFSQVGPYQIVATDPSAATLSFAIPREMLLDHSGNAPHPEVPLTDWQATSVGSALFGANIGDFCFIPRTGCVADPVPAAHDAMPDQGNGTIPLVVVNGVAQSGHARLTSESPTRASNGEATTMVYQVQAQNRGPKETFSLSAVGVPAGWSVRLPAERIVVPGNSTVLLPILVSVPFAHQHGTYQKFVVELHSLPDPGTVGRIQLGIRYTNPPQPAGHHNTLWLHSGADPQVVDQPLVDGLLVGNPGLSMNALADDPLDAHKDVAGWPCGSQIGGSGSPMVKERFCWSIPLQPQLELGLDFDLTRTGNLGIPVKTLAPLFAATLTGTLYHVTPGRDGNVTAVARLEPAAPMDLAANSQGTQMSASIVPTPEGDFVPYAKGAALVLELEMDSTGVSEIGSSLDPTTPAIQPGGLLSDLPLNEYHDPVGQVFASNGTLELTADAAQDRPVNPGKTVLFNLTLENHGQAGDFDVEVTGTHLAWTRLLTPATMRLAAGASGPVRVAVQVPTTADKGDVADLVVAATSAHDLNLRSLARLYASVETDRAYPDDAPLLAQAAHAKHTPGPEVALLGPAVLALAALSRRSRGPRTTTAY